jgi:hypothetical protein
MAKLLSRLKDGTLGESGDYETLVAALKQPNDTLPAHQLTKSLWKEYGPDCVNEDSVSKYRLRNTAELRGL